MRKHELLFANFICKFGVTNNLLDFAEEIVLPTFLSDGVIRSYGRTQFILHKTKLVSLARKKDGTPVLAVTGHFIKDTSLAREQVFKEGRLVGDAASIQSSPSAFFMLLLHNHRLLYLAESTHAPPVSQFENSIQFRMRRKWGEFIDRRYDEMEGKRTKKSLRLENPTPTISVVPLARQDYMPAQLNKLSEITTMKFSLIHPNDEPSADIALGALEARFRKATPSRLQVSATDNKGLKLSESKDIVVEALSDPSVEITVKGKYATGATATVTNEDLALSVSLEPGPTDKTTRKRMYEAFRNLQKQGAIKLPKVKKKVKDKLDRIATML